MVISLLDPSCSEVENAIEKIKEFRDVNVCCKCVYHELSAHDEPCDSCAICYSLKFEWNTDEG